MSVLSRPYFHCEEAAFAHLESIVWADGVRCPHCGSVSGKHYDLGKTRLGLRKCSDCRKQFTVKVGTVFESAHIPLHKMLQAVYLMCASKKGVPAHQLHRVLEITYKSAWFLCHRIREAMASNSLPPMGGEGKTVEADETYITVSNKTRRLPDGKRKPAKAVLSLVERNGAIRSMYLDNRTVGPYIHQHIHPASRLVTDGAQHYKHPPVAKHESVDHSKFEWSRGDVHTNTLEGFFSVFKRGLVGTYQHVDAKHLHRYLAEFDFRYNNRKALGIEDQERANNALTGIVGKRLTYQQPDKE